MATRFILRLDILVIFIGHARVDALTDDELIAAVLFHFKQARNRPGRIKAVSYRRQINPAAVRPGLREHMAHPLVEINHHLVAVLLHDPESSPANAARAGLIRHHQALGGLIACRRRPGYNSKRTIFPASPWLVGDAPYGMSRGAEQGNLCRNHFPESSGEIDPPPAIAAQWTHRLQWHEEK